MSMNLISFRPTWIEINLSCIEHNFKLVKKIVGQNVKVLVVVKADAYGHGIVNVSRLLNKLDADYFGVTGIEEAIILRRNGIKKPILIFETILPQGIKPIIDYNLTQTICTENLAIALHRYAKKSQKLVNIHIKIDTGMGRIGIWHKEALSFIKRIKKLPWINIEGLYTHFPSADVDSKFTKFQINCLKLLKKQLANCNINIPLFHAANSMGLIGYKESHFDMVRPGLMLYGLYPKDDLITKLDLKPALSLKSKIIFLKNVSRGHSVSYGRKFISHKNTTIATLPIGYSNGYTRYLSNNADVLFKGRRFRIAGRICMDQTMIDMGNNASVKVGDTIILVGRSGKESITLEELSRLAKTIPYEIACNLGKNIPRFYKYSNECV